MDATDLLQHLRGAGLSLSLAIGGGIRVAPAHALTDAHRQAIRNHRAELLALLDSTCPATPTTPATSASPKPEFKALVTAPAQPTADPDRWCWPHSTAMNCAEIAAFTERLSLFIRRGMTEAEAEARADNLVIRDRQQGDRRMCLERTTTKDEPRRG